MKLFDKIKAALLTALGVALLYLVDYAAGFDWSFLDATWFKFLAPFLPVVAGYLKKEITGLLIKDGAAADGGI